MKTLESKNLLIACVWAFMTTVVIAYFWVGEVLEVFGVLLIFFIALMSTGALLVIPKTEEKLNR